MQNVSHIPYLSQIEHVEAVRALPIPRRLLYAVLSSLGVVTSLVVLAGLSVLLGFFLYETIIRDLQTETDYFLVASSILCTFLVLIGFSANPIPHSILPGDTLVKCMQRAFRGGVIFGLIAGFVFGVLWMFTLRISGLYVQLNTALGTKVYLSEYLNYGIITALATTFTFALFRAFFSLNGHLMLKLSMPGNRTVQA